MNIPDNCFITDLPTTKAYSRLDFIEYSIELGNKKIILRFDTHHQNSSFVDNNKQLFKNLLLQKEFPKDFYLATDLGFDILPGVIEKIRVLDNEILENIITKSHDL